MDGIFVSWRDLLVGILFTALFLLLAAWFKAGCRAGRMAGRTSGTVGRTDREAFEREMAELRRRLDAVEANMALMAEYGKGEDADSSPHALAMLLVRDGLDANELAKRCGISVSEASLIVTMHRNGIGR